MIRVLIADDHRLLLSGIRAELSRHPDLEVVGEAITGDQVIEMVSNVPVDAVILDISMPGMKVMDVIRRLKRDWPELKILILTAYLDKGTALGIMKAGADGYVLKDDDPVVIPGAIRDIMAGKTWLSSSVATFLIGRIRKVNSSSSNSNLLTEKEIEIIRLISEGLVTKDISSRSNLSVRTIESHITNIYSKLGVGTRASAVSWAKEHGVI